MVGQRTGAKHSFERIVDAAKARKVNTNVARDVLQSARGIDELLHIKFRPKGPQFNTENGWWKETLDDGLPETFELIGMVEQKAHFENHVSLSDERNELGWRKLRVDWSYSEMDKEAVDRAATPIMDALEDAGVVDATCRTHEHDNLYVAGMSVFPSVGYANPTLTAMALGARLADNISG
ncbi:MAG: choline dehydrogenase-like flavoprotein [Verrucomicrobiales bacterium]